MIAVITVSVILMSFPSVRQLGVSLLASAGLLALVVGMAARPALENLIAGLQIALTQPIKLDDVVVIDCRVSVHHKTGVEMEALTGASVAALTVYDMCKGASQEMVLRELRLIEKRGGKQDYQAPP